MYYIQANNSDYEPGLVNQNPASRLPRLRNHALMIDCKNQEEGLYSLISLKKKIKYERFDVVN